jgi:hypothetical protein
MKKEDESHFKSVLIFILFIFLLFFISNDKKMNRLFSKNSFKFVFLIFLVYMAYLKVNLAIILFLFILYLLLQTDFGKRIQKNRYIKRVFRVVQPYLDEVNSLFQDLMGDESEEKEENNEIDSSEERGKKRVHFQREVEVEEAGEDDDTRSVSSNIIDQIRSSMKMEMEDDASCDQPARQMNPFGVHSAHHPLGGDLRAKVDDAEEKGDTSDPNSSSIDFLRGGDEDEDGDGDAEEPVPDPVTVDTQDIRAIYQEYMSLKKQASDEK